MGNDSSKHVNTKSGGNVKSRAKNFQAADKQAKKEQKTLNKKSKPTKKKWEVGGSAGGGTKKPVNAAPPTKKSPSPQPTWKQKQQQQQQQKPQQSSWNQPKKGGANVTLDNRPMKQNLASESQGKKFVADNARGLTRETQLKQLANFDSAKEKVVIEWINGVVSGAGLRTGGPEQFESQLNNGKVLCRLINAIGKSVGRGQVIDNKVLNQKGAWGDNARLGAFVQHSKDIAGDAPFDVPALKNPSGSTDMKLVLDSLYKFGMTCNKKFNIRKMKKAAANTGNRME